MDINRGASPMIQHWYAYAGMLQRFQRLISLYHCNVGRWQVERLPRAILAVAEEYTACSSLIKSRFDRQICQYEETASESQVSFAVRPDPHGSHGLDVFVIGGRLFSWTQHSQRLLSIVLLVSFLTIGQLTRTPDI
jgi:hypothetical protein